MLACLSESRQKSTKLTMKSASKRKATGRRFSGNEQSQACLNYAERKQFRTKFKLIPSEMTRRWFEDGSKMEEETKNDA